MNSISPKKYTNISIKSSKEFYRFFNSIKQFINKLRLLINYADKLKTH